MVRVLLHIKQRTEQLWQSKAEEDKTWKKGSAENEWETERKLQPYNEIKPCLYRAESSRTGQMTAGQGHEVWLYPNTNSAGSVSVRHWAVFPRDSESCCLSNYLRMSGQLMHLIKWILYEGTRCRLIKSGIDSLMVAEKMCLFLCVGGGRKIDM